MQFEDSPLKWDADRIVYTGSSSGAYSWEFEFKLQEGHPLDLSDTDLAPTDREQNGFFSPIKLNNIDFRKMIGGPLQAAVDAQVASSLATVNFINSVGFETADDGKKTLVMVDFSHTRKDVDAEGNEVNKDIAIRVPLLAMLPIPSLRIEHVIIDFKVKLNSVESSKVSDKLGVSVSAGGDSVGAGVLNLDAAGVRTASFVTSEPGVTVVARTVAAPADPIVVHKSVP